MMHSPPLPVREWQESFASGGRSVPVECFDPPTAAPHPAAILLHGSDGLAYTGAAFREMARGFAGQGFAVHLVHYLGDASATAGRLDPLRFLGWMQVVADAVSYAATREGIDPRCIALVGVSLGAYLALAVASQDARVAAVVNCCGGLPEVLAPHVHHLPPTLILHGEDDRVVPVSEARNLERRLRQLGQTYEIKIYPGTGHGFWGEASTDAFRTALDFLQRLSVK